MRNCARGLRLLVASSAVAVVLTGCDWKPWRTPGTAPYSTNYSTGPDRTADPIRAELYIYETTSTRSVKNFAYVGKPWVFEFPAYTYFRLTDPEGGPQGWVVLDLDPETMEPMWVATRKRYGWDYRKWPKTDANGKSIVLGWSFANALTVELLPMTMKSWKRGYPAVLPRSRAEWNKWLTQNSRRPDNTNPNIMEPHGRACEVDWYRAATTNPNDPASRPEFAVKAIQDFGSNKIDGLEFSYYNLQGYVDDNKYGGMSVRCDGKSQKCGLDVYLPKARMFAVRLNYPIRYACQYREMADKVDALLAKHTISYPSFDGGPK